MELQELAAMEMDAISNQDADLLEDLSCVLGRCGMSITGAGSGSCGGGGS